MQILLTFLCVLTITTQTVFQKQFGLKNNHGKYIFSGMISFFALIFFIIISGGFSFVSSVVPYSILFAFCYTTTTVAYFRAVVTGPVSMSSLIFSYSLIIPTLYGLIFLKEIPGIFQITGIFASLISLFFVGDKINKSSRLSFSKAWLFYITVATAMNGFCSVIQKAEQTAFSGQYKNEFMIYSLFISSGALIALSFIKERKYISDCIKQGALYALVCGVSNGLTNLLVMVTTGIMAASLFFPLLSAGQIIAACIVSSLLYHEKLKKRQYLAVSLGILAVILLNLK